MCKRVVKLKKGRRGELQSQYKIDGEIECKKIKITMTIYISEGVRKGVWITNWLKRENNQGCFSVVVLL